MAYLLLQNGVDRLQLQDGGGNLLLQEAVGGALSFPGLLLLGVGAMLLCIVLFAGPLG